MAGADVVAWLVVDGAMLNLDPCGVLGNSGDAGTTIVCWHVGQLICIPEYSGVAAILC
jgi:hypothetical protein